MHIARRISIKRAEKMQGEIKNCVSGSKLLKINFNTEINIFTMHFIKYSVTKNKVG